MVDGIGATPTPVVTVIGEALIDLVPLPGGENGDFHARPGGSPFNVAIGLARLGHRTALMSRLADNTFGRILRRHAVGEGVDLTYAPHAVEPTTLAIVSVDSDAQATYDFYLDGTADWQWTSAETSRIPLDTAVIHFGSVASWTTPGDVHINASASEQHRRGEVLISYDPNVRPMLLRDPSRARHLIERSVTTAHIAKASRDDVEWLYPGMSIDHVGARWLELGAQLAVITDGADGAHAFCPGSPPVHRPGRRVTVVDTVGAGDAFTAGLLSGFVRRNVHRPDLFRESSDAILNAALDDAILISAVTCERVGADPPAARIRAGQPTGAPLSVADLRFADQEQRSSVPEQR